MNDVVSMQADAAAVLSAQRAYLRRYIFRAGWGAVLTGGGGLLLMMLLFLVLEPLSNLLNALRTNTNVRSFVYAFWFASSISLLGMLFCGVVTLSRWSNAGGTSESQKDWMQGISWLNATRTFGAVAFVVFLAALAVPPHNIREPGGLEVLAPNYTPAETIQLIFFLICGGAALTLMANRRCCKEVRWVLLGEESERRRSGFEVLMPSAGVPTVAALPATPIPAGLMPEPSPSPVPHAPMQGPVPTYATSLAMRGPAFLHPGARDDGAGAPHLHRLVAALSLVVIGLLITHLSTVYALRREFKGTQLWKDIYKQYSEVPLGPVPETSSRYRVYPTTRFSGYRYGYYNNGGPPLKSTEPIAGFAAVFVVASSLVVFGLNALILLWAVLYVIAGPRLRGVAVVLGWLSLIVIALGWLAHSYLIQAFKFAPDEVAVLSIFRRVSSGELRDMELLMSPLDLSLRQLVIPLAVVLLLSGSRMKAMFRT